MKNSDLVLSISNLLKTNKGFFKSEKQASFILSCACDNEIVNHFTTYGNVARDHYLLDAKGVYKIERYTTKKGYVTTWERGQVHQLESAKNRDDMIRQEIEQRQLDTLGYTVESKTFYNFIELFNSLDSSRIKLKTAMDIKNSDELASYLTQYDAYASAIQDFKTKYFSCCH